MAIPNISVIGIDTAISIRNSVKGVIDKYEPRINIIKLEVIPTSQEDGYNVTLTFRVNNTIEPETLSFILQRIR